jgi:hypothetical protein
LYGVECKYDDIDIRGKRFITLIQTSIFRPIFLFNTGHPNELPDNSTDDQMNLAVAAVPVLIIEYKSIIFVNQRIIYVSILQDVQAAQYRITLRHRPLAFLTNDFGRFLINYLSKSIHPNMNNLHLISSHACWDPKFGEFCFAFTTKSHV